MDASIVKDFQRLRVLASYDLQRMDELVQDLTNALEETSRSSKSRSGDHLSGTLKRNCKKRRGRKRRPNSTCRYDGGNFSEASESSVEEAVQSQELRENAATTTQQSDSDDLVVSKRFQGSFPKVSCVHTLAESDSVTENFSPLRPHRRRRKCKRMSIEPTPLESCDHLTDLTLSSASPDQRKPPYSKPKLKTLEAQNANVVIGHLRCDGDEMSGGKRKRKGSAKDGDRLAVASHLSRMDCASQSQESSSSFSSSESDCGIFTNDEARDGDDEQSDFFHEPGPACGVPGIVPWWENERSMDEEDPQPDSTFNSILTGSFELMSASAKAGFKARITKMGRQIRTGRRRLKSAGRMDLAVVKKLKAEAVGLSTDKLTLWHGCNGSSQSGDIKRRRQTPPDSPSNQGPGYVGDKADPIPESNIGNQMLRNMGWNPGQGLGVTSAGITQPIFAYRRAKRKGLGASDES